MGAHGEELIFVLLTVKSRRRPRRTCRASPGRSSVGCLGDRTTLASVVGPATGSAAGVEDVLWLAEERDRRHQGPGAICCALREAADRTCVPTRGHAPTPFERVFTCLYRAGSRGIVREPEGIETPLPGISSERAWSKH